MILAKENTTNILNIDSNFIINITQVSLETFSNNDLKEPGQATIIGEDYHQISSHPGSKFNVLETGNHTISDIAMYKDEIVEAEEAIAKSLSSLILVIRSSFRITNFLIKSNYTARSASNVFVYPVYIQSKQITLTK